MYFIALTFTVVDTGTSFGANDLPWCDCKIVDKFYEKNVLWSHIECRSFNCKIVPFFLRITVCCFFVFDLWFARDSSFILKLFVFTAEYSMEKYDHEG